MRIALLTLAIVLFGAPALAETPADFPAEVSVTGEAQISVAPDIAFVDAGVATDAKTAREASEANNSAMAKVFAALKSANIDARDIQTSRLSLQPQYAANRSTGPASITGYRASNRLTVKIRDIAKVANVIDTLVGAGANDVGNISFSVTQASKLLDDAREKAMADARRKAEIYARAAGVALGAPLSISEEGAPQPMFRGKAMAGMAAAPTPIAQGEETLSISVSVTWAIKGP